MSYYLNEILRNSPCVNKFSKYCAFEVSKKVLHHDYIPKRGMAGMGSIKQDWNNAVSAAEKIVGYPTSYFGLRWLLSDEVANIAVHLRKLVGTNHPLVKTAKQLVYSGKNNMQTWGLVVLLLSKAVGHKRVDILQDHEQLAGVLNTQRALAEVTEMIRTGFVVHWTLMNFSRSEMSSNDAAVKDLLFGNRVAILSGDYLLAQASAELAALRNSVVVETMATAIRDMSESEFIGQRDKNGRHVPHKGMNVSNWLEHAQKSGSTLLGYACQSAMVLADHNVNMQRSAFHFGSELGLVWQVSLDLEAFSQNSDSCAPFSLASLPIVLHLQNDSSLLDYINAHKDCLEKIDYQRIRTSVLRGSSIQKARDVQRSHSHKALETLKKFGENDACKALANIIFVLESAGQNSL